MSRNETRIPSLDGVRAIAIALVVLAHFSWNQRYLGSNGQYLRLGDVGVKLFFVLSGFLITSILLRELDSTSALSLSRFYFRRVLRIFPAFYTFVGVMIVVDASHWAELYHGSALPSLTYTSDYFLPAKRVFGHTWSLAVEEQFYLLWPPILLILGRRGLRLAGAMVIVCPLMRVASFALAAQGAAIASAIQNPLFRFDTQADALAVGCLLAGQRVALHERSWYRHFLGSPAVALMPVAVLAITMAGRQQQGLPYVAYLLLGCTATNIAVALSLDWCLTYPGGVIGTLLNARPVAGIGVMSYSIYLWQEPFLYVGRTSWWQSAPFNIALVLLAASGSYVLVERPFLRMRKRWEYRLFTRSAPREHAPSAPDRGVARALRWG